MRGSPNELISQNIETMKIQELRDLGIKELRLDKRPHLFNPKILQFPHFSITLFRCSYLGFQIRYCGTVIPSCFRHY